MSEPMSDHVHSKYVEPQDIEYFRQSLIRWVSNMSADELAMHWNRMMQKIVRDKIDKALQ